jgi:hypothetical protein
MSDPEDAAREGEPTPFLSAVDDAIVSARRSVEKTKAMIEETRKLLAETRDVNKPLPPRTPE